MPSKYYCSRCLLSFYPDELTLVDLLNENLEVVSNVLCPECYWEAYKKGELLDENTISVYNEIEKR